MRSASLLLLLVISGCSGALPVTAPTDVPPPVLQTCADLVGAVPESVAGQDRRATDPESALTVAWGDPAIVLRCGVPRPATLKPSSQLVSVNGVDWFAEELTGGYLFTTYGRQAFVEVSVPAEYAPEVGPITEVGAAVTETVPARTNQPASSP